MLALLIQELAAGVDLVDARADVRSISTPAISPRCRQSSTKSNADADPSWPPRRRSRLHRRRAHRPAMRDRRRQGADGVPRPDRRPRRWCTYRRTPMATPSSPIKRLTDALLAGHMTSWARSSARSTPAIISPRPRRRPDPQSPAVLPTGRNHPWLRPLPHPRAPLPVREGRRSRPQRAAGASCGGRCCQLPRERSRWSCGERTISRAKACRLPRSLALIGAPARGSTAMGASCGAQLIPLAELGRPRIDVVVTLSGICRDLLPLQTRMIAEAAWLATSRRRAARRPEFRAQTYAWRMQATHRLQTWKPPRCGSSPTPKGPMARTSTC